MTTYRTGCAVFGSEADQLIDRLRSLNSGGPGVVLEQLRERLDFERARCSGTTEAPYSFMDARYVRHDGPVSYVLSWSQTKGSYIFLTLEYRDQQAA